MNIEEVRQYCLSKPLATEDAAFGPEGILFRIYNKIFAYLDLERPDLVVVKCDADYAIELRDKYNGILPAWHWNKGIEKVAAQNSKRICFLHSIICHYPLIGNTST